MLFNAENTLNFLSTFCAFCLHLSCKSPLKTISIKDLEKLFHTVKSNNHHPELGSSRNCNDSPVHVYTVAVDSGKLSNIVKEPWLLRPH